MSNKKTEYTTQYLENQSADMTVNPPILRRGLVGKASDGKYYDVSVNVDGSIGSNPSMTVATSVSGTVTTTTLTKTIGSTSYEKTIEEDSSDNSTVISAWSEV
jgi:hypothetical protein